MIIFSSLLLLLIPSNSVAQPAWSSCPVWTPEGVPILTAFGCPLPGAELTASCATLELPLDYDRPERGSIDFFVKRVTATARSKDDNRSAGQVWLVNGGPGNSGVEMECMVPQMMEVTGRQFDFYIPDHRGTGRSSPLFCDWAANTSDSSRECVEKATAHYSLEYLHAFSASNAARDMHAAIGIVGRSPVMVHGVSYGTYLAQRFLQLFPSGVDAVLLDGVTAPDLIRISWSSPIANSNTAALAAECDEDGACGGSRFELHSISHLQLVFEMLTADTLPCNARLATPFSAAWLRGVFGDWVRDHVRRLLVFPVVRRLLRCNEDDVAALDHMHRALGGAMAMAAATRRGLLGELRGAPSANDTLVTNGLLGFNIGAGEFAQFENAPLARNQVDDMRLALLVQNNGDASLFEPLSATGYVPYSDPLSHLYPDTDTNMLLLVGTLDPQTVPQWALHGMATAYARSNQRLVLVPWAVHAVASLPGLSPVVGGGADCAFMIAASFYNSSGVSVDTSCLAKLEPPDFAAKQNQTRLSALAALGTEDAWGGP